MAEAAVGRVPSGRRTGEIPFDSARKRLTTVPELDGASVAYTKGAPETVLPLCTLDPRGRADALRAAEAMAADGLRVLAFAHRTLGSSDSPDAHLSFAGLVGMVDPARPEVPDAIRRCREAGIRVVMVTGDHPRTAAALARSIGLGCRALLTGAEVQRMSDEQLQIPLDAPDLHFARLDPGQAARDRRVPPQARDRRRHRGRRAGALLIAEELRKKLVRARERGKGTPAVRGAGGAPAAPAAASDEAR